MPLRVWLPPAAVVPDLDALAQTMLAPMMDPRPADLKRATDVLGRLYDRAYERGYRAGQLAGPPRPRGRPPRSETP